MTRTSAEEYAADGIYMTSVDPGWASNENPEPIAAAMRCAGVIAEDGAVGSVLTCWSFHQGCTGSCRPVASSA